MLKKIENFNTKLLIKKSNSYLFILIFEKLGIIAIKYHKISEISTMELRLRKLDSIPGSSSPTNLHLQNFSVTMALAKTQASSSIESPKLFNPPTSSTKIVIGY